MDKEAIWSSSENELHELRLTGRGHIICLKNKKKDTGIKKELAAAVKQANKEKVRCKKKKLSATSSNINKTAKLEKKTASLGWMNYDKKKNDFVTAYKSTGGGTRTVAFPNTANGNDILSTCKELFFPEDIFKFGKLSNMDVKLGNFKRDVIRDVYSFNLENYIKANKLTKTRLYIMTKKLSPSQLIKSMNSTVNVSDSDEDSDDSFLDFIYSDRTI